MARGSGGRRRTVWAVWAVLAGLAAAVAAPVVADRVPPEWNPWAPLSVAEPPTLLTRYKLRRLARDPEACAAALATSHLQFEAIPDRVTGPGCGWSGAVRVSAAGVAVRRPFVLSCPAAVSLALWERHALQPAALARFGVHVARLEHYGSYACRGIYHRPDAPRSRHATGDALDVAGFVLADGRSVALHSDWDASGAEGEFLRDVRDGACRYFDAVLSPDYNAAHADHLHLDRGPYRVCR